MGAVIKTVSLKYVCWWSAGVTSAVATKYALDLYGRENVDIYYFITGAEHDDNERFISECERWYGKHIIQVQSSKFKSPWDVAYKRKYINGVAGAPCTSELKKKIRFYIEEHTDYDHQIFGFEFSKGEINRAIRFKEQYPETRPVFPLIEKKIDKPNALYILENIAKIRKPTMYSLGFKNNNCIGCFKGAVGYHNKLIKKHFPEIWARNAKMERDIGASICKKEDKALRKQGIRKSRPFYLDEMSPEDGRGQKEIESQCGVVCQVEFGDIIDDKTELVLTGQLLMDEIK